MKMAVVIGMEESTSTLEKEEWIFIGVLQKRTDHFCCHFKEQGVSHAPHHPCCSAEHHQPSVSEQLRQCVLLKLITTATILDIPTVIKIGTKREITVGKLMLFKRMIDLVNEMIPVEMVATTG